MRYSNQPGNTRFAAAARWFTVAALLSAGVLGGNEPAKAASTPASQELRVGVVSHVNSLDVQEETSNVGAQFLYSIYDTLIEPDALADSPKYLPGLATS